MVLGIGVDLAKIGILALSWLAACWAQPSWPDLVLSGAREAGTAWVLQRI